MTAGLKTYTELQTMGLRGWIAEGTNMELPFADALVEVSGELEEGEEVDVEIVNVETSETDTITIRRTGPISATFEVDDRCADCLRPMAGHCTQCEDCGCPDPERCQD